MKRAFLFLAVAMLYCNFSLAQEPDPDPNLLWKTENGYDRFLVHPNGNILAGKGFTEVELDGNTGEIIREFPHPIAVFYDVSPDGKYISGLADSNRRCVIDYDSEEILEKFTTSNSSPKFMPDNKTLIYSLEEPGSGAFKLASFNMETNQHSLSPNNFENTQIGNPSISPDGRFVATGGWYYRTNNEGDTHLLLWDAQTLEPIRVLGEFENFNEVRSIKFSPDSRLVGFGVYPDDLNIYETENLSHFKYDGSIYGFGFVTSDFIAIGNGKIDPPELNLVKLETDQIIYSINNSGGSALHNKDNNTMIVIYGHLYCYDFEKILSGASIKTEIQNPFTV
ncbi:MAG: hypothetical protein CVV22_12430 [Ignavibacteriae bacterium HGW-Ignavibacteriae-1]|jgi:WD40 repeat protein|nr:MAG: hypothetical protein CVV22_12430 [Ignavibacteriae bacterium HGW-Ignavibacteriae-1]